MSRFLLAALMVATLALSPLSASAAEKSAFTDAQKNELNEMIGKFIADNPESLIGSVEKYYNNQAETAQAQTGSLDAIPENMEDAHTPVFGPKDAKVTIVQFFDYNCGYCKQVATDFSRLMDSEKNVRFIFKELPILSDTSELAARYALAAHKQGKYLDFHNALMAHQGPINESFLKGTSQSLKLDVAALEKEVNTQELRDALNANLDLARMLGVRGTPFFLFNTEKVPGAIGYTRMKEIVDTHSGVRPAAAAATPAAPVVQNPAIQAEIEKAQKETADMIRELKEEAQKIQQEARKQMEEAQRLEASKEASKEDGKKAE